MKEKKILHYLDLSSFVALILSAGLILVFQSQGNVAVFEYIVAAFMVALFALVGVYIVFIVKSFKSSEIQDEESREIFELSKKQKIWLCVKAGFIFLLFCFSVYVYFTI